MDAARAKVPAFTPVERSNREITPRSRRRHFSQRGGVTRLVGAVLNDLHDEWQVYDRRYLCEGSMAKIKPSPREIELVAAIKADDGRRETLEVHPPSGLDRAERDDVDPQSLVDSNG